MMAKEISFFERIARRMYITDVHDDINYYLAKIKLCVLLGIVVCIAATTACLWLWTASLDPDPAWWLLILSAPAAVIGGGLAFYYIFYGVWKWPHDAGLNIALHKQDFVDFISDFECYHRTKTWPPSALRNFTKSFLVGGLVGGGFIWGLSLTAAIWLSGILNPLIR